MKRSVGIYIGIFSVGIGLCMAILLILFQTGKLNIGKSYPATKSESPPEIFITYPFARSLFPPDMAAPTFKWNVNRAGISNWFVQFSTSDETLHSVYLVEANYKPDSLVWEKIKRFAKFNEIDFRVSCQVGSDSLTALLSGSMRFSFSRDSVSAPLFFRQVDLPFKNASEHLSSIEWRLGDISHYKRAKTLLTGVRLCGNCHSFSDDGKVLGIDFDYQQDKGGYATVEIEGKTRIDKSHFYSWSNLSIKNNSSSGFLSALSPNGRYVVTTINDLTISSFHENDFRFFPVRGMLGIYDRYTGESFQLSGANDTLFVQCNAVWSPNGETIVFAKANALSYVDLHDSEIIKALADGKRDIRYDLWAIPFNEGKGGMAKPIAGASANGKSNFFPRVSPDGKWMVFTQANAYMLRQLDSKLFIVPFKGGVARELECNLSSMNSWHTWSPNSKWIAFSTKGFSPYTKIALTHIDTEGHASPPVLLENFINDTKAINLPEFVSIDFDQWESIELDFLDPLTIEAIDFNKLNDGRYLGKALLNGFQLRPVSATLSIEVKKRRITAIELGESQHISNSAKDMLNKIIRLQTIDMFKLGVNSTDEMVLVKAVEDGLKKGLPKDDLH